jgi:hypothetical protein
MGEAKRKKAAAAAAPVKGRLPDAEANLIGMAIRQVVGATTSFHGADCIAYALVGAEVLRRMGFGAKAVAGSAAWRVGPGDGDVLSHAIELNHQSNGAFAPNHQTKAGMFHAWIECGLEVVDFTTYSFPDKARQLDSMDGNKTLVQWAPEFLWVAREACSSLQVVANGFAVGVFAYIRNPAVERVVLTNNPDFDAEGLADQVFTVMELSRNGHQVRVIGIGDDGAQEFGSAVADSVDKGLKRADGPLLFGLGFKGMQK